MKQSIIIVSVFLMAILTLLAGWRINQQDKLLKEYKKEIDLIIKDQVRNQKNDDALYKYFIRHEASIRLLKNR